MTARSSRARRHGGCGSRRRALLLGGCSSAPAPPQDLARDLADKVGVDGMYVHLRKLQEIADANNGSRAEGTPGYDASVDYVAQTLRDKGFDVQTPEFERLGVARPGNPTLTVSGRGYPVDQASLLTPTPAGGLRAVTLRPQKPAGCAAADYGTKTMTGRHRRRRRHRMLDRRQAEHRRRGGRASGFSSSAIPAHRAARRGCSHRATTRRLKVPVGVIDADADAALRRTDAPVLLTLDAKAAMVKSRNVVAQTKTGDTHNVVMAGAHLDTVAKKPRHQRQRHRRGRAAGNRRGAGLAAADHQRRAVRVLGVRGGGAGGVDEVCRRPGP